MSQFYRCDAPGCGAEAEHPGVDYGMEETHLPDGWKTGPQGDFCPKHPMRVANGSNVYVPYVGSPADEEFATVKAYDAKRERYTLWVLPPGADDYERITRKADVVHTGVGRTSVSERVPIETLAPSSPGQ